MGWSLNWFRSGGGNEETVYDQIELISARIIEDKEIKAILLADEVITAKIEDAEVQTSIYQEQTLNVKIEN
jgi:3-hydroxyacyl-CoA dehydrogenase